MGRGNRICQEGQLLNCRLIVFNADGLPLISQLIEQKLIARNVQWVH